MDVQPLGLPAALKTWRERTPEPVLVVHCTAEPECGREVGAVYDSPNGLVVESRISAPQEGQPQASPVADLADLAGGLGVTGLLADFDTSDLPPGPAEQVVQAQIDLLHSDIYWQNPIPVCPEHGQLRVEQTELANAVRQGQRSYPATSL